MGGEKEEVEMVMGVDRIVSRWRCECGGVRVMVVGFMSPVTVRDAWDEKEE